MDAVDVVVTAESADKHSWPSAIVDEMVGRLRERVGQYVFAEGDQTWADALAARLGDRTLAVVEFGTAGQLQALLGNADFLLFGELVRAESDVKHAATDLGHYAQRVRDVAGADIGVAAATRERRAATRTCASPWRPTPASTSTSASLFLAVRKAVAARRSLRAPRYGRSWGTRAQ